jgi:hypothetical protein
MISGNQIRSFDFIILFWGRQYREYFVELCLPSLLAPRNLPLLKAEDGHRFLIATTNADWRAIKDLPIINRMRKHTTPVWIEINEPESTSTDSFTQYATNIRHMGLCLKKLMETAYPAGAYGCMLCNPDVLVSDGLVSSLQEFARAGHRLVLCPALRQTEENVLTELRARGFIPLQHFLSHTAEAINIPPRMAADIAIRHLHPELAVFEEGANGQPFISPFRYWRMPEDSGLILHTFYAVPVLADFSFMKPNHTACLERDHWENIYIGDNFRDCSAIHIVQDSDDLFFLSLAPERSNFSAQAGSGARKSNRYHQLSSIRRSMEFYVKRNRDTVRRDLFRRPVRWHTSDLDAAWMAQEREIEKFVTRAIGDYWSNPLERLPRINSNLRYFWLDLPLLWTLVYQKLRIFLSVVARRSGIRRMIKGVD